MSLYDNQREGIKKNDNILEEYQNRKVGSSETSAFGVVDDFLKKQK